MKPKFKVGETVQLIASPDISVFILETLEQTCYANVTQNWYNGRVVYSGSHRIIGKIERFSEIELMEKKKPSEKLQKMIDDLKALREKNMKLIKKQDFEKAAALRDDERNLKYQIETESDIEGINDISI